MGVVKRAVDLVDLSEEDEEDRVTWKQMIGYNNPWREPGGSLTWIELLLILFM